MKGDGFTSLLSEEELVGICLLAAAEKKGFAAADLGDTRPGEGLLPFLLLLKLPPGLYIPPTKNSQGKAVTFNNPHYHLRYLSFQLKAFS